MEYCRQLKFEQEPNYRTCLNFFESCMQRHNFDANVFDYSWKQNGLSKDKEALKNSMLPFIKKKPAAAEAPKLSAAEAAKLSKDKEAIKNS